MIEVAIADDHRIVREGICALLDSVDGIRVTASSGCAVEFYDAVRAAPPDVALLDINMPGADGFDLAATLLGSGLDTRMVFLTSRKDPASVKRAFALGASGFVLKDDACDDLIKAVTEAADGHRFVSAGLAAAVAHRDLEPDAVRLAPREGEVLRLVAAGLQNKEIAEHIGVSIHTVRTHRARLMDKLDLHSGPELVRYALERGLA